jgi:hypothetical protein
MRMMEIPPFPREIRIPDLDYFVRTRLSQTVVMWPEQSIPLLGYMCFPNDAESRAPLLRMLRNWQNGSEDAPQSRGNLVAFSTSGCGWQMSSICIPI